MTDANKENMTKEEERELIQKAQNNDRDAMKWLLLAHKNYIYKIAHETALKYKNCKIEIDDLFTEGTLGLMTAIQRFDLSMDNKLLTYAAWYIRQRIQDYIKKELNEQNSLSLDEELNNEGSFHDFISDTKNQSPEEQFEKQIAREKFLASILDHMNILTEKEKKVVSLKYGLYNNKPMTTSEIKDELKCTRAVIRDLERRIRYKIEKAGVNFPEIKKM